MEKKSKTCLGFMLFFLLVIIVLASVPFNSATNTIRTVLPLEQGDTRIQQHIDFQADNVTRKYYIHTYIEVYNNGWKKAEEWRDHATADEVLDIKAMRKLHAEEEAVEIGKAIREFYYGREN